MKKYNINVNGKMYQVEVEEVGASNTTFTPAPAAPVSAPTPAPAAPAPTPAAPKAAPVAGAMTSPMPGTIIDIKVTEGQSVKAGDILMILEAMKMENEIVAPSDGKIVKIHTTKGAAVSTGDALVTIG